MPWVNPTPEEAKEEYDYSRSKYMQAASEKAASERAEQSYIDQRKTAMSTIQSCKTDKTNFEKRIKQIEEIIKMLEGRGGFFSEDVPESITNANTSSQKADQSFKSCIKCDGISSASLDDVFHSKSVEEDSNSNNALNAFKNEKARLEEAVENLERQISSLSSSINDLNTQIRNCNSTQASLRHSMNGYAYEMSHYKRYM